MKDLRTALYLVIILETVSEMLCFGSEFAIQKQDHKRFALFHKVKEDEVLEGHVISVHDVLSQLDCLHKCLSHDKCTSLNFEIHSSDSRHACELNDVTRALSGHALGIRDGFSYWEPVTSPQQDVASQSPLQQGQSTPSEAPTPAMTSLPALGTSTSPVMTSPQPSTSSTNSMLSSSVQQPEIDCGANWHRYSTGCVQLFSIHKTRSQAKTYCQSFQSSGVQGNLVSILSEADNDKLVSLSTVQGKYYIGLMYWANNASYLWEGGVEPQYTNWFPGHPIKLRCAFIHITHNGDAIKGKWITEQCGNNQRFICECPGAC